MNSENQIQMEDEGPVRDGVLSLQVFHVVMVLIITPAIAAFAAFPLIGPRAFSPYFWTAPFVSIGIGGAALYLMYQSRGLGLSILFALFLALAHAGFTDRHFNSTLIQSLLMFIPVPLICHALKKWKIDKPKYGRLVLLAPIFAVALGLEMLIARGLIFNTPDVLLASRNQTRNGFMIGVALALGLEFSEWLFGRAARWDMLSALLKRPARI